MTVRYELVKDGVITHGKLNGFNNAAHGAVEVLRLTRELHKDLGGSSELAILDLRDYKHIRLKRIDRQLNTLWVLTVWTDRRFIIKQRTLMS